jgi:hypothetical protein
MSKLPLLDGRRPTDRLAGVPDTCSEGRDNFVPPGWGASELCRREQMQFKEKLSRPNRSRPRPNRVMKWAQPNQKRHHHTQPSCLSGGPSLLLPGTGGMCRHRRSTRCEGIGRWRARAGGEPRRCLGGRRRAVWGGPMREGLLPYPVARPVASLPLSCISAMPT